MLVDFKMKNFASFKEEMILSAETGAYLKSYRETNTFEFKKLKLLKNLLIFGPNGAGKTWVINGLLTMKKIVLSGGGENSASRLSFTPFALDDDSRNEDTSFTIDLLIDSVQYQYRFDYNARAVTYESLDIIKRNKTINYFKRQDQNLLNVPDQLKAYVKNMRINGLFLYIAQQFNDIHAMRIFNWFDNDLYAIDNSGSVPAELVELMKNQTLKDEMVAFLRNADFNIIDIRVRDIPTPNLQDIPEQLQPLFKDAPKTVPQLFTVHKKYNGAGQVVGDEEFSLSQESLGTIRIFKIVLYIIYSQVNGSHKTILIDEFDDSLHNELSQSLVRIFNSKQNLNQFILTTHNIQLMDLKVRIDQIYLAEKDFHGISTLNSIFDFNDPRTKGRLDIHFAKRYIEGRYGAVPIVDTEELLKTLARVDGIVGEQYVKNEEKDKTTF